MVVPEKHPIHRARGTPAIDQAGTFLRQRIACMVHDRESRFPAIRELAKEAGCSVVTLWKAAQILAQAGEVELVHGRRMRLLQKMESRSAKAPVQEIWERTRTRIASDIAAGRYGRGMRLPAYKSLCQVYGVAHGTLRKALESLVETRAIERYKRGFRLSSWSRRAQGDICLAVWGSIQGPALHTPWAEEHLRQLENACADARLRLRFLFFNWNLDKQLFVVDNDGAPVLQPPEADVLGYLLWTITPAQPITDFLSWLGSTRKPIAILDEEGRYDFSSFLSRRPKAKLFKISFTQSAGRAMGRYLLHRGHHKIVYLSAYHQAIWSINRLAGLQYAYHEAGKVDPLPVFALHDLMGLHSLKGPTKRWRKAVQSALQGELADLLPSTGVTAATKVISKLEEALMTPLAETALSERMIPLFDAALKEKGVTAWVCGHDIAALLALDYLREKGLRVPDDISLVGFDNSFGGFSARITSFNFNLQGLAHSMLSHVLSVPLPGGSHMQEIEGMVVERGSVASL